MTPRKRSLLLIPACIALASVAWPVEAAAQRHAVVVSGGYYAHGHPYYPYYYNPFFFSFGFGYGYGAPFYPYTYGYPYPYGGYYYYDPTPELRVQVTPRQADVYIDGYLVGTVDDYDGTFQRLHVPFGEHEVSVYREGYHTITERMLFRPGQSYNMKQAMQPLEPLRKSRGLRRTRIAARRNAIKGAMPRIPGAISRGLLPLAQRPNPRIRNGMETGLGRWRSGCSPLTRSS